MTPQYGANPLPSSTATQPHTNVARLIAQLHEQAIATATVCRLGTRRLGQTSLRMPGAEKLKPGCGELGKQDNCQIALHFQLPIIMRAYRRPIASICRGVGDGPYTSAQSWCAQGDHLQDRRSRLSNYAGHVWPAYHVAWC